MCCQLFFIRLNEKTYRDHRDECSHRLDLDILNTTEDRMTKFVHTDGNNKCKPDGESGRDILVNTGQEKNILGLVDPRGFRLDKQGVPY